MANPRALIEESDVNLTKACLPLVVISGKVSGVAVSFNKTGDAKFDPSYTTTESLSPGANLKRMNCSLTRLPSATVMIE